ncbi:MAG: hypothetical protein KC613_17270 [Myxococcales bacterium]|nr:hypothetical protein [Myxococcales bacterium]MCB9525683.1 hypothetical protein [Myxococcales bacterium]
MNSQDFEQRGECRILGTRGGATHYAWAEVSLRRIPGPTAVVAHIDEDGDSLPAGALPEAWVQAAVLAVRLTLADHRRAWLARVTGLRGTSVDTTPMTVAVAGVRATLAALGHEPPAVTHRLTALLTRDDGPDEAVPELLRWALAAPDGHAPTE